jgi:hypothetical protein
MNIIYILFLFFLLFHQVYPSIREHGNITEADKHFRIGAVWDSDISCYVRDGTYIMFQPAELCVQDLKNMWYLNVGV